MKVDYLSDLHIDFYIQEREFFNKEGEINISLFQNTFGKLFSSHQNKGEVLVVAGDLGHSNIVNIEVLKLIKEYYNSIIVVFGNHDYYINSDGKEIKSVSQKVFKDSFERVQNMKELISKVDGIFCLDGDVVEINGIRFGGCSSWYDGSYMKDLSFDKLNSLWRTYLNDSRYIYKDYENGRFRNLDSFNEIWLEEKEKIEKIYKNCDVFVTHVNPSSKKKHQNSDFVDLETTSFYSFNGEKYIKNGNIKYWVFGHTHNKMSYKTKDVNVVCNPIGYPFENGNLSSSTIESFEVFRNAL